MTHYFSTNLPFSAYRLLFLLCRPLFLGIINTLELGPISLQKKKPRLPCPFTSIRPAGTYFWWLWFRCLRRCRLGGCVHCGRRRNGWRRPFDGLVAIAGWQRFLRWFWFRSHRLLPRVRWLRLRDEIGLGGRLPLGGVRVCVPQTWKFYGPAAQFGWKHAFHQICIY